MQKQNKRAASDNADAPNEELLGDPFMNQVMAVIEQNYMNSNFNVEDLAKELLELDDKLCKLAQLKAEDMVANDYFSHESPNLGNPFEMMKNNNIEYMTAGENIAGYKDVEGSVNAWMNSKAHKDNILSNGYNYTGIGVAKSEKYGYVFVQLFMGKYEN